MAVGGAAATGISAAVVVVVWVIAKIVVKALWQERNGKARRGPGAWPIIGHFHLLTKHQPIHRSLWKLSQSHGPIMHLRLGFRPVLVISSAEAAKECLATNDKAFASRPRLAGGELLGYASAILGSAPYGQYWRNLRRICLLDLLSCKRVEMLKQIRTDEMCRFIRSLYDTCNSQKGDETVHMRPRLSDLTFNIIVRMVANKRYFGPQSIHHVKEARQFQELINEMFYFFGVFELGDFIPFLRPFDIQGYQGAMKRLHKKVDAFMQALVDEHRQNRRSSIRPLEDVDLIDVLLSATETDESLSTKDDIVVKATALTMITAGTDSSAVTIEWALAALLEQPHVMKKAQEELDREVGSDRVVEERDLPNLKYLQAIVKETFRLYPAGPLLVPHESTQACRVGGCTDNVPAGTMLLVNAWAIHRDPVLWDRPTEFDPDRFLKSDIDVRGHDMELIPFGSGRRSCPGISLALCIVQLTLARLLHSFNWSVPFGTTIDMAEGLGLSMPKAVPLQVLVKLRLPLHLH